MQGGSPNCLGLKKMLRLCDKTAEKTRLSSGCGLTMFLTMYLHPNTPFLIIKKPKDRAQEHGNEPLRAPLEKRGLTRPESGYCWQYRCIRLTNTPKGRTVRYFVGLGTKPLRTPDKNA
jgi:hypothetical protein